MKMDNGKKMSFKKDVKEAKQLLAQRNAKYKSYCQNYKKANPDAKSCKLTKEMDAELKGMMNKTQVALANQKNPSYKPSRDKFQKTIRKAYN